MGGADKFERMVAPIAEALLILLGVVLLAIAVQYFVVAYIKRHRQHAHEKLSRSRRDAETAHNLFTPKDQRQSSRSRSSGSSRRRRQDRPSIDVDLFAGKPPGNNGRG